MVKIVGIDLGTTNSVVAQEGLSETRTIRNAEGDHITPSVVTRMDNGEFVVGSTARDNALKYPQSTVFSVKRLMGRRFSEPGVQEMLRHPKTRPLYQVVSAEHNDGVRIVLGGEPYSPVDISAAILAKLKKDAEAFLGGDVTHAVITVPAYFSLQQREATRRAGLAAGLKVKQILDEPTAAAIAHGVASNDQATRNVLVYDLGGGTFDISVLQVNGDMFDMLACEGDMWMGGDDFDQAIVNYVLGWAKKDFDKDLSGDQRFMLKLREEAEKTKIRLSGVDKADLIIYTVVALKDGDQRDVDLNITRYVLETTPISGKPLAFGGVEPELIRQWCLDLGIDAEPDPEAGVVRFGPDNLRNRIKKTILLVRKALLEANLRREDIDLVLLVGGSTMVPLVRTMVEEEFGAEKVRRDSDPMLVVALGAAIAAERITSIICPNCGTANELEAQRCSECDAPLDPVRICSACGQENPLDAEACRNQECGRVFKSIETIKITAKPIGLLAEGGQYEEVVGKGTPYPTNEPLCSTFKTSRETSSRIHVQLYHAEVDEFRPDDYQQLIGRADIELNGRPVAKGTRVTIQVDIDGDGCLDVKATLQDGKGTEVKVRVDPESRMEAREPGGFSAQGLEAEPGLDQPGERREEQMAWQNALRWSVLTAEIALQKYEWLLEADDVQRLKDLLGEAREALAEENQRNGQRVEEDIDSLLSRAMGVHYLLIQGEMAALSSDFGPEHSKDVMSKIEEIARLLRSGKAPESIAVMYGELMSLLSPRHQFHEESTPEDIGSWLERDMTSLGGQQGGSR